MEDKQFYRSRTFWISLITAVAPHIPQVGEVLLKDPATVTSLVSGVFFLLRITSSDTPLKVAKFTITKKF